MPSLKLLLERFQHRYDPGAELNREWSHPINNHTLEFVIPCCVVSKQVGVSTVVESTCPWLRAGTCLVFINSCQLIVFFPEKHTS